MRIQISQHNGGNTILIGTVLIDGDYSEQEIAAIANESGGISDLISMGDWTGPAEYEPTGDDVYEIVEPAIII